MKLFATTALVLSMAMGGAAFGQDVDPAAIYESYLAAVDAGDYATASERGEAAWRAAETEWGESGDTGLLAYTVAQLRVSTGDLAGAAEPAARALELAPQATGLYTTDEARLLVGASLVISNPAQAQQELEAALSGLDGAGVAPRDDIIAARLNLASLQAASDTQAAAATAAKAVADSQAIMSANLRAHLAAAGRIQYLAGQFGPAVGTLTQSLNLWEEQPVGSMPAPLASTLAWHTLASAAAAASAPDGAPGGPGGPGGFGRQSNGPGRGGATSLANTGPSFAFGGWGFVPDRNCTSSWAVETPPAFPAASAPQANLGAVVVLYDLTADGAVTNVEVVGRAPTAAPEHEAALLSAMSTWRAEGSVRENCRQGRMLTTHFYF